MICLWKHRVFLCHKLALLRIFIHYFKMLWTMLLFMCVHLMNAIMWIRKDEWVCWLDIETPAPNYNFDGKAPANNVHTRFEIGSSSLDLNKMIKVYFHNSNSVDPSHLTSFFLSLKLWSFLMKLKPLFTYSIGPE